MMAFRRQLRRLAVLAFTLPAVGALAVPAASADPAVSDGTPRVRTIWSPNTWAASNTWRDLPNAEIRDQTWGPRAMVVVTFSAETHCKGTWGYACSIDIQVGNQQAKPQSGNYRFDTTADGGEWESHSTTRTVCVPYQSNGQDLTTKVRAKAGGNAIFEIHNWHLKVEHYRLHNTSNCTG